LTGERTVSRPVFEREGHYPVKHLGDPRRREAEIAVPTVPYRRNQSRLGEFRQMRAGCLRRNTRSIGQFGRCKSAAIEKRREHGRSCRLSDQPSNLGDQWPGNHRLNLALGTARPQVESLTALAPPRLNDRAEIRDASSLQGLPLDTQNLGGVTVLPKLGMHVLRVAQDARSAAQGIQ
jgi:hypothetical protein